MLHLMTHSAYFLYSYMASAHLGNENGNSLPQIYVLRFPVINKGSLIYISWDSVYHSQLWSNGWNDGPNGPIKIDPTAHHTTPLSRNAIELPQ